MHLHFLLALQLFGVVIMQARSDMGYFVRRACSCLMDLQAAQVDCTVRSLSPVVTVQVAIQTNHHWIYFRPVLFTARVATPIGGLARLTDDCQTVLTVNCSSV